MSILRSTILVGVALLGTIACSKSAPGSGPDSRPAAGGRGISGNVCDLKLLSPADLAGMTRAPISRTAPLPGDASTCMFITDGDAMNKEEIHVTLRPGLGHATIASFTSGRMNEYVKWELLSGVGETAVWKPELKEVAAQQDDLLCEARLSAVTVAFDKTDAAVRQKQLGNLCNLTFQRMKSLH